MYLSFFSRRRSLQLKGLPKIFPPHTGTSHDLASSLPLPDLQKAASENLAREVQAVTRWAQLWESMLLSLSAMGLCDPGGFRAFSEPRRSGAAGASHQDFIVRLQTCFFAGWRAVVGATLMIQAVFPVLQYKLLIRFCCLLASFLQRAVRGWSGRRRARTLRFQRLRRQLRLVASKVNLHSFALCRQPKAVAEPVLPSISCRVPSLRQPFQWAG